MRRFLFTLLVLGLFMAPTVAFAQEDTETTEYAPHEFVRGRVLDITEEGKRSSAGLNDAYQVVLVEILNGPDEDKVITVEYVTAEPAFERQKLHEKDVVVLAKVVDARGADYYILDVFRLPAIAIFGLIFFFGAAIFGRWRGVSAVFGLGVSLLILMKFIVPGIIAGGDPVVICAIGSAAIAVVSLLLAHGFNRRSFVALAATLISLLAAFILASLAVSLSDLSGSGTEEAVYLQLSYLEGLDLRGLLLGGIVIGALGVLDDVTTAQVAAVEEIHKADESLNFRELYSRGLSVGREHIAALVNTLALAYAGASFPLFLLFALPGNPPLWVVLNGEQIIEEAVRALVGGSALILAVPISTLFAALVFEKRRERGRR